MGFNKKGLSLAGAVLVAASLWTFPLAAQERPRHHAMRGGMAGERAGIFPGLLRAAELTPEQRTQVRQVLANHRETFRDLFGQLQTARQQITSKLLSAEPVTEADLAPYTQEIAQVRDQLAQERLKVALEVRNILTPEQLAKVSEHLSKMKDLRSQMRELRRPSRTQQQ
jgi:periplasmic protein CpxP/Spy